VLLVVLVEGGGCSAWARKAAKGLLPIQGVLLLQLL
jgi:hypothetical protein